MPGIDWLLGLPDSLLYLILGFSAWLENVFPPIPGDTITALGAFLVGIDRLSFEGVFVSTSLGSVSGFITLYLLARFFGRDLVLRWGKRYFTEDSLIKAEERLRTRGYIVVFLNRFMPGIRSVISVVSGILGLNMGVVTLLSALSASLWNLLWIWAGYSLGSNWEQAKAAFLALMGNYNLIAGSAILLVASYLFYRWIRSKRSP